MKKLVIETIVVGDFSTNCYVAWQEGESRCLVIDPGNEGERILSFLRDNSLVPEAILLTHGHGDHIGAVEDLKAAFKGLPLYVHEHDLAMLTDPELNLSCYMSKKVSLAGADQTLAGGETLSLAGLEIKVIHTPGHTRGGVCYLAGEVLFSGDTLFMLSIGRTDFPGGSFSDIKKSIAEKLYKLPRETRINPGHGHSSDIGQEIDGNPYVKPC